MDNHAPVFSGLGKLKNKQVELANDETITPVAQRRIPFHLYEKEENELEKLEQDDIIEKIPDITRQKNVLLDYKNVILRLTLRNGSFLRRILNSLALFLQSKVLVLILKKVEAFANTQRPTTVSDRSSNYYDELSLSPN